MADLKLNVNDAAGTADSTGQPPEVVRRPYMVVAEHGLTKRGQHYPKGTTVELDEMTAANFLKVGDISDSNPPAQEGQTHDLQA